MPTYKTTAAIAAILSMLVAFVFLFVPVIANFIYGIDASVESNFILRRAAFLLVGMGLMCWLTRDEAPSVSRNAISLGFGVGLLGILVVGASYTISGLTGPFIWLFTFIELVFGTLFIIHSREAIES